MPALEDVGLVAAEAAAGIVTAGQQLVEHRLGRTAVVAGDDHQGLIGQSLGIKRIEHLADGRVDLHHEVGVRVEPAPAEP